MPEAGAIRSLFDFTGEPIRRGRPDDNIRLDFRSNFHRVVEVTSDAPPRTNARRGR
jgi:hypothetical protein